MPIQMVNPGSLFIRGCKHRPNEKAEPKLRLPIRPVLTADPKGSDAELEDGVAARGDAAELLVGRERRDGGQRSRVGQLGAAGLLLDLVAEGQAGGRTERDRSDRAIGRPAGSRGGVRRLGRVRRKVLAEVGQVADRGGLGAMVVRIQGLRAGDLLAGVHEHRDLALHLRLVEGGAAVVDRGDREDSDEGDRDDGNDELEHGVLRRGGMAVWWFSRPPSVKDRFASVLAPSPGMNRKCG